ncbi:FCD domain-containing protein [Bosea sp. ANAM02]|uniref:FCD domain-containing protein n=1 Tax=Bosea sp. ANAM02 TaxID=2020412 RepID=UPI001FCE75CC|nr:FCD domain-containing protein [Bosea sp. ANAM02]
MRRHQATRNPVLAQSYEAVQQKIWRYRFTINELSGRLAASYAEHEGIMVALRARARLDLAERLEEHNRLTGEAMAQALATSGRFTPAPKKRRRSRPA